MHEYHENLPGYDPAQIWHDGCGECEHRGKMTFADQLGYLDVPTFQRAVERAVALPSDLSTAELTLITSLHAVLVRLNQGRLMIVPERGYLPVVASDADVTS